MRIAALSTFPSPTLTLTLSLRGRGDSCTLHPSPPPSGGWEYKKEGRLKKPTLSIMAPWQ
jgi:hypothetical protein